MFEPGYTPRGWVRGCTIDLALPPRFPGHRTYGRMQRAVPPGTLIEVISPTETHTVNFCSDDMPQVKAWLRWWYGHEPKRMAEIDIKFREWE